MKLRQGTYSSIFLRGGYKSGVRPRELESAPFSSAFTKALTSLSSYSTQVYKRLSCLWNGVSYKRGVVLYLYYSKVSTGLSVSCTQVSLWSLSSTPRESLPGGAGRPPIDRLAWGCGHVATAFAWMLWIFSWSRWKLRSPNSDS